MQSQLMNHKNFVKQAKTKGIRLHYVHVPVNGLTVSNNFIDTKYIHTRGKSFCKTSFQVGMDLKSTETRREMKTQEDYPTFAKNTQQI